MVGGQRLLVICVQLREIFQTFFPLLTVIARDPFSLQEHEPNQSNKDQQDHQSRDDG